MAGFAEAEGCFTAGVWNKKDRKSGIQVAMRFIIAQKGEPEILERIGKICGGKVANIRSGARVLKDGSSRPAYEGHNMTVSLTKLNAIIEYFKKHPLKTKKRFAYNK